MTTRRRMGQAIRISVQLPPRRFFGFPPGKTLLTPGREAPAGHSYLKEWALEDRTA